MKDKLVYSDNGSEQRNIALAMIELANSVNELVDIMKSRPNVR